MKCHKLVFYQFCTIKLMYIFNTEIWYRTVQKLGDHRTVVVFEFQNMGRLMSHYPSRHICVLNIDGGTKWYKTGEKLSRIHNLPFWRGAEGTHFHISLVESWNVHYRFEKKHSVHHTAWLISSLCSITYICLSCCFIVRIVDSETISRPELC